MFGEPLDTEPEQQRRYFELLARLSPAERARIVSSASRRMRLFVKAGAAHLHPGASEGTLRKLLAERLYGAATAERLFGASGPGSRGALSTTPWT